MLFLILYSVRVCWDARVAQPLQRLSLLLNEPQMLQVDDPGSNAAFAATFLPSGASAWVLQ